jgi:hypothetical protein
MKAPRLLAGFSVSQFETRRVAGRVRLPLKAQFRMELIGEIEGIEAPRNQRNHRGI